MTPTRQPRAAPPASPQAAAYLALQRAADRLLRGVEALLASRGLTPSQYNVLRILRGAGPGGLACREIAARMITRDPDITRLLARLEARGLAQRGRLAADRRVVRVGITPAGLRLLAALDGPVAALHARQFRRVSRRQLETLLNLLEAAESGAAPGHPKQHSQG